MDFNVKLKQFRKALGVSQKKMAESLGIGRTTYTNIERGATLPSSLFIKCFCAVYGVTPDSFECDEFTMQHTNSAALLIEKYNRLEDKYKAFLLKQIDELLHLQQL